MGRGQCQFGRGSENWKRRRRKRTKCRLWMQDAEKVSIGKHGTAGRLSTSVDYQWKDKRTRRVSLLNRRVLKQDLGGPWECSLTCYLEASHDRIRFEQWEKRLPGADGLARWQLVDGRKHDIGSFSVHWQLTSWISVNVVWRIRLLTWVKCQRPFRSSTEKLWGHVFIIWNSLVSD